MSIDCGFFEGDCWFRYRAAAIIVEDGAALFAGNCEEPFYYAVGGGVHVGETAEDAVVREVEEETGVHYDVDRLAVVHENFFDGKGGAWEGKLCHEVFLLPDETPPHARIGRPRLYPRRARRNALDRHRRAGHGAGLSLLSKGLLGHSPRRDPAHSHRPTRLSHGPPRRAIGQGVRPRGAGRSKGRR